MPAKLISLRRGGGADGSVLIAPFAEADFDVNAGLNDSINNLLHFMPMHPAVSPGDLVQFAGAVALSNCPVSF
jgi:manganese peroxidase